MNNILIKAIILFLFISITGCSYKPIFSEKNYGFEIEEVILVGEKRINRIIYNKLNFIKNKNDKGVRKFTVEIKSEKVKKIVSKDSKGDPLKFEMNISVNYQILSNGNVLLRNDIEKSNIYNNETDQFKLGQSEDIILENLTDNISDILISSIINLNDN
tara:strand:- start:1218 stop:1694 length:477 start_codon:yes stop_codon:yes gene_type:complete